jgi:anti-sigma-K factor RskA
MSAPGPPIDEEDGVDLTAAEHVLGLLEGEARRGAEARRRTDPAFRAEIEDWEEKLAPLTDAVDEVAPPAGLWRRIEQAVGESEPASNVVAFPPPRPAWDRVGPWRAATALSAAAAAACVVLLILRPALPPRAPVAPTMVATLSAADGKPLYVAVVDRARRGVTVVPVSAATGAGRWPELWIIPADGKPRPVGMVGPVTPRLILASSALIAAAPPAVLAVSLEPRGGSPTGAPTGPVIATGTLRAL